MGSRQSSLQKISSTGFEAVVVGGGINGAISSLALASHGQSVLLIDENDFASGISQHSSNLVWGGFKYLENYEFLFVFKLCRSRNRLVKAFPNRIVERRFLAALDKSSPYPPWFAAMGANTYWTLGQLAAQRPNFRTRKQIKRLEPAVDTADVRGGIEYSDYYLPDNDSRFVSEFVLEAEEWGATTCNYVKLESVERKDGKWELTLIDTQTGEQLTTSSDVLVNTAGPTVTDLAEMVGSPTKSRTVFSKGIHLIVPQISDSGRILAFYDDSGRLFYVIPMGHRSVIGTTDTPSEEHRVVVEDEDRDFLLDQINQRLDLANPISVDDVIAERFGVRTLVVEDGDATEGKDWVDLSRKHVVETNTEKKLISILGGKITDCLNVGHEVVEEAAKLGLPVSKPETEWYGEPNEGQKKRFLTAASAEEGLDRELRFETDPTFAHVLWRRHGKRAFDVLAEVRKDPTLGRSLTELADMCMAEVKVMADREKIVEVDDFLRRRTKLSQLNRLPDLASDPGIQKAVKVLLGEDGLRQLEKYRGQDL